MLGATLVGLAAAGLRWLAWRQGRLTAAVS
jgi:hypothetical protein